MEKTFISFITKKIIDFLFLPVRKSKNLLSHVVNHTLHKEIEEMSDSGNLFPMNHIHQGLRLSSKLINRNFIIVDIGGGIGASLKLFTEYYPDKKIIAFEPVSENFAAIRLRFPGNDKIELVKSAVGNENTNREIHIAGRITSSSILPLAADPGSKVFNKANLGQVRTETIEIVRLDDFMANDSREIGIMKIDVQGFEMEVLMGAEKTLARTSIIILEANNHEGYTGSARYYDIDSFLREHGFTLYNLFPSIVDDGRLKEWDMIYLNNSAKCVSE